MPQIPAAPMAGDQFLDLHRSHAPKLAAMRVLEDAGAAVKVELTLSKAGALGDFLQRKHSVFDRCPASDAGLRRYDKLYDLSESEGGPAVFLG